MSERRYSEDEVAEIFRTAADTQEVARRTVDRNAGMTLAELQEIGREAGIAPEAVAYAARLQEQPATAGVKRFLGLPIGVGKTIELARPLTETEWERLVVDLRETFEARGKLSGHGSFRQWTNGNLQVLLEPTETGQRLRMQTVKGNVRAQLMAGIGLFAVAVIPGVVAVVSGVAGSDFLEMVGPMSLIGVALFGVGGLQLPGWARKRRAQMESIAARAGDIAAAPASPALPGTERA